jgi:TPR repeat protein
MKQARSFSRAAVPALFAALGLVPVANAQFASSAPATPTTPTPTPAQPAPVQEPPFDVASKLYEQGRQAEALVTLRQLAEAGDARAQYLVGLDLLEGKYIARDNPQGFAYLLLAEEDVVWGDLVAPRAREARAMVEPQLSGPELIRADQIVGAFKARAAAKR